MTVRLGPFHLALASLLATLVAGAVSFSALAPAAGRLCAGPCLDRAIRVAPPDKAGATETLALVERQLANSPFDDSAWLRLAAAEPLDPAGRLSPNAIAAVEASYRFAPIDAEVVRWRTLFVFNHWADVGEVPRRAAQQEVAVLSPHNPAAFSELRAGITDPAGRLAYSLLMQSLGQDR